jgi:hypothetical protein
MRPVALGLLAAWVVHDTEELTSFGAATPRIVAALRHNTVVPARVVDVVAGLDTAHMAVAVAITGLVMTVATVIGVRTNGRGFLFHVALLGFGAHGLVHLGQAVVTRGYVPGLVTALVVVVPYSVWGARRLWRAGLLGPARAAWATVAGLALFVPTVALSHALATALL